jgi:hypothetical protein
MFQIFADFASWLGHSGSIPHREAILQWLEAA